MSEEDAKRELLPIVEDYVVDSFSKNGEISTRGKHLLNTRKRLLEIYPQADEAMQIAAVAHDIDSAFIEYKFEGGFTDPDYLREHQIGAAAVLGKFLVDHGADMDIVEAVTHLVEKHEEGGDNEQNLIKDADSLSFFDGNLEGFIDRHSKRGTSKVQLREKFDWMYDRITSQKAKEIAQPMYDEAIRLLEST